MRALMSARVRMRAELLVHALFDVLGERLVPVALAHLRLGVLAIT